MDIKLRDFQPIYNNWKLDAEGPRWEDGDQKYIIDQSTGRSYFNESESCVQTKCFLLTLGTPFVHIVASICNIAYRFFKITTLSHFRVKKPEENSYQFITRLSDSTKDLLRIVATPLSLLGLELAAIYGILKPYDGRKLYATIERATYNHFILAPCFQPSPTRHLFGGNPNLKNQY